MGLRDFSDQFKTITGTPIFEVDERNEQVKDHEGKPIPVTYASLVVNMLCARDHNKEPGLTNAQSRERIKLADRIVGSKGPIEVDSADISLITAAIERYAPTPYVAARCLDVLDKELPKAKKVS